MPDYVRPYIDKIEDFARSKRVTIELLLIGGLAMSFYGIPRHTVDIDAEIKCSDEIYFELVEFLKRENTTFNISDNISGWGIVPLPANYRERARNVYETENIILKTLDPVDFIFSKLMRGTEEDFNDAIEVIHKYGITKDSLIERENLIKFPKDPETLFFKKKFQHLMEMMQEVKEG